MSRGAILSLVLLCGILVVSTRAGENARQVFPLSPGTYWVYHGLVRSWMEDSTPGNVTAVTWKMSVARVLNRDGVSVAIVNGFPSDLDWSEGQANPQRSMLVGTVDSKFYLNSPWDTSWVADLIDAPKYPLDELARPYEWILQLPLTAGERFGCDEAAAKRQDGKYCWVVGSPSSAELGRVKGVAPGQRQSYEINYDAVSDDTEIEFVPGVGITSYEYHHHGAIAETELHLVEFHSGDAAR
ncbi:MAG TPA: hypothetical protein VEI08_01000 [Candidatus Bathyarchaeia archaeon]|nr:hypothetical protein [Candidatus Bathyarchaeia archaeon]